MLALHRLLQSRHVPRLVAWPPPAAVLHGGLATGFLVLAVSHLAAAPIAPSPARRLLDLWWLLEATAIWCVPVLWWLSRIPGNRALVVRSLLTVLAITALAAGVCGGSTLMLCGGVVPLLALARCAALSGSSVSRRARELLAIRVLAGVVAGLLAIVAAAVALVIIRETFSPAVLSGKGAARGALLVTGVFYFASLAVLEVKLAAPARRLGAP